jgi:hypothetical protein
MASHFLHNIGLNLQGVTSQNQLQSPMSIISPGDNQQSQPSIENGPLLLQQASGKHHGKGRPSTQGHHHAGGHGGKRRLTLN